jgi:hypothetical protein
MKDIYLPIKRDAQKNVQVMFWYSLLHLECGLISISLIAICLVAFQKDVVKET